MVKRTEPRALVRIALVAGLLLPLLFAGAHAAAQGLDEEGEFALQKEYRVEVNELGDAHITDVISYDEAWFDEYGYILEENPNLLSRRYRSDSNVGEVEDFDVDIDAGKAKVTISFDTPGLAYNLQDGWTLFGYTGYELEEEGDDEVVLKAAWTFNNEWTLFETMGLEERVVIDLPSGAQDADFDESSGTLTYSLPVAAAEKGFFEANKTALIILFSLLMALSLVALLFLLTRKPAPAQAIAAYPHPEPPAGRDAFVAPAPPTAPAESEAGETAQAAGVTMPPREETSDIAPSPQYCRKCGHPRGSPEERFCRKCGAPHY